MRIANSVLDLPGNYRHHGIRDLGNCVEAKVVRDKKPQKRPRCGERGAVVHGHVERSAYHVPVKSKPCIPIINLRRYKRKRCGKTFFEPPSIVSGAGPHVTVDLESWVVGQTRLCRSFSEITRGCGASADVAQMVADRARPCHAPRARHWQDQEGLDARAAERRNGALSKIADALAGGGENHRELRRACLMPRLLYEWAAAGFAIAGECREVLSSWISQAGGCRVKETATAARSVKEVKALVVDAYTTGRANAHAENVNEKIEDVERRPCGFAKREDMRRRLLLAFGCPPLGKGGVPLPNRNE